MPEEKKEERKVIDLSIDDILPNRFQPRIKFDDTAIFELSESIKAHGVFQPIIVRPIGDKYEIIAGERRYKASVLANKKTIPAIVMDLNDNDTVEIALIENVQRANLTPIEEAISYKKILDMGYMNQEELAQKLGKTQSTVANKLRLLNLDEEVQEALLENKISERHARSILRLKDYEKQRNILERIIKERLTVRKTDEVIEKMINEENPNVLNNTNNLANNDVMIENTSTTPLSSPFNTVFSDVNNEIINPIDTNTTVNTSSVINNEVPEIMESVAPTVMDIDLIEKNAQDVNVVKPVAPMEEFLSTPKVEHEEENNNAEELLRPGKFFNFIPEESEIQSTPNYNESKNFNFDNLYSDVAIPSNNVDSQQLEKSSEIKSDNLSSEFEVNVVEPVSVVEPKEEILLDNIQSTQSPIIENSISAPSIFGVNDMQPASAVETKEEILLDNVQSPLVADSISVPNSSPFGFGTSTNFDNNTLDISNVNPSEEVIDINNQPSMISDATITAPAFENIAGSENVEIVPPVMNQTKNVNLAVSTVRDAITEIEQLGFVVDVDEIDLESMYQLIVKIEK